MKSGTTIILTIISLMEVSVVSTQISQDKSSVGYRSIQQVQKKHEGNRSNSMEGSRSLQGPKDQSPSPKPKDPPRPEAKNQMSLLRLILDRIFALIRSFFGFFTQIDGITENEAPSMAPAPSQSGIFPDGINEAPTPSTVKIISDYPSMAPSDYPSMIPSDSPSMIPSDSPSMIPSDSPSMIPSDSPSMVPSDAPSISPSYQPSQKLDPFKLPDGYEACPTGRSFGVAEMTQITIVSSYTFSYTFTVEDGTDPEDVTKSIGTSVQVFAMEELCIGINDKGPIAISSGTTSNPNSFTCEEGPCYMAELQVNVLVAVSDNEKEIINCNTQQTLDDYITSTDFIEQIDGVDFIQLHIDDNVNRLNCSNYNNGPEKDKPVKPVDPRDKDNEPPASVEQESSSATLETGPKIGIGCAVIGVLGISMAYVYMGSRRRRQARGIALATNASDLGIDEEALTPTSGMNMINDQPSPTRERRLNLSVL